ncbi:MAG: TonB-dependent siderophore receptor [Pseudomonadota bacterium]
MPLGLLGLPALATASVLVLDESSVTADAEAADGPVSGYRATRSASATRTDTDIRDIPLAISVVPAQVLEDLGSSRIDDALDFAGGVSRQNNFGGLSFLSYSIRGFTTGTLYKNGFSINRGSYSSPDAASIERIEVLKGPAASLYGRGDPGGTVNIVTKKPQAEAFATLNLSAGRWDRYRSSLDVNTPLDDDARLLSRVTLAAEDNQSFRDYAGNRRVAVSPSLSWQAGPDTRLLIESEFIRHSSVFDRGIPAVDNRLGSVSPSTFLGEPNDGEIDNRNEMLQTSLEHDLNDAWYLRLANHYAQGRLQGASSEPVRLIDGRVTRFYRERAFEWNDSITQLELHGRFEGAWQHQVLAGLEYENYRNSQKYPQSLTTAGYGLAIDRPVYGQTKPDIVNPNDFFEHVDTHALNLQDQIRFGERLQGLVGLRLERFEQTSLNRATGSSSDQTHEAATPRAGLLYQLTPQVGVFANVSSSFKPNGTGADGRVFEPEEGLGYEAGLKLDLFDDRLGATLAAFHITKQNVLTADPNDPGQSIAAGEARSQGIDLQVSGQLGEAVRLIGAFAFIDAQVTQGDAALPAGSPLLGIARQSGSLLGVYEFQDGALRGADLGASLNYVGERSGQAGSDFTLPAYTRVDLLAHYPLSQQATLGLNLNNLFDKHYYERSFNAVWVNPGEPRNLSLSLSLQL